jgi:excisionase family DNA binding protein
VGAAIPKDSPHRNRAVQAAIKLAEVLTMSDVARLLNTSAWTVCRLAESGDLPGFRFEGTWRFRKGEVIDAFVSQVYAAGRN